MRAYPEINEVFAVVDGTEVQRLVAAAQCMLNIPAKYYGVPEYRARNHAALLGARRAIERAIQAGAY